MLHTQVLDESAFRLLKELMSLKELENFYLVGGTALALQMGHRLSVDLDLFSDSPFQTDELLRVLPPESELLINRNWMFRCLIGDVKCDFVSYPHLKAFNSSAVPGM
jgi:hypothetical protein